MKRLPLTHVFLNGDAAAPIFPSRPGEAVWVADGGMRHARYYGFAADVWLGDFDSSEALPGLARERRSFPRDKDESDWELLLQALPAPALLAIVGFWGGELDHQWANLASLAASEYPAFIAGTQMGFCLPAPFALECTLPRGSTVSILAMDDLQGLHSVGLRWPWRGENLSRGQARGCRNQSQAERIRLQAAVGKALLFMPRETQPQRLHCPQGFWEAL